MSIVKTIKAHIKNDFNQDIIITYDSNNGSASLNINDEKYSFICEKDIDEVVSELNFVRELLKFDK